MAGRELAFGGRCFCMPFLTLKLLELENRDISGGRHQPESTPEVLKQKLEANRRKLESISAEIAQKNASLAKLKMEIDELNKLYPGSR
jgi:hypothetical protein